MTDNKLFFEQPVDKIKLVEIKVYKKNRILELYGDNKLLGRFKIVLGGVPEGNKHKEGDSRTPEGKYYICTRNDKSKFTLFLGISYPDVEAAERGLNSGLINEIVYDEVKKAQDLKQCPPWNTPLGGAVGIHGGGILSDWTKGCIALSDKDIKIIWEYAQLKTPVYIYK
jgi:murein L,D-transpeptidase YafK